METHPVITPVITDLGGLHAGFAEAQGAARRFGARMDRELSGLQSAGAQVGTAFAQVGRTIRQEMGRFAANRDVQVVVEIAREKLDESWRAAKAWLQRTAERSGITVAVAVVEDRANTARAWLQQTQRTLSKHITVRVELARRELDTQINAVRARLETLNRFRAVRIAIAAVNGVPAVARAALATLAPLRTLAVRGIRVVITATAAGLTRAVHAARSMLAGFAAFATSVLRSPLVLLGGFVGGVASVIAAIRRVQGAMGQIDSAAKFSDRIGVATEKLVALRYAGEQTGVAAGQLDMGLQRMTRRIATAAQGSGEAVTALQTLGLSAEVLASQSPDQQFLAIADAMEGVSNQGDRVRLAFALFDSEGVGLVNTMRGGADAVRAMMDEAEQLGVTFDRVDAAKVEMANDAFARIGKVIEGVWQSIAIELAPSIQAVADLFTGAARESGGFGQYALSAIEWVTKAIATASDYLSLFEAGWKLLKAAVIGAGSLILRQMDLIGSSVVKVLNLIPGVNMEWTDTISIMADDMMHQAAEAVREAGQAYDDFATGANAARVTEFFDTARDASQAAAERIAANAQRTGESIDRIGEAAVKQQEKIREALDDIQKDIDRFGMSDLDIRLAEFKGMEGVTDEDVSAFETAINRLKELQTGKEIQDAVDSWRESLKTPLEKLDEQLARIDEWRSKGLISDEDWKRGRDVLAEQVKDLMPEMPTDTGPRLAGLLRAGSQEAFQLQAQIQSGQGRDQIPREQLRVAQDQRGLLEEISRKLNLKVA